MAARSSDGKLQELLGTLKTDGVEALDQLMDAYEERRAERASRQKAILRYVTPPTAEQLAQIREFLRKKYENEELPLELVEDKSLLGGGQRGIRLEHEGPPDPDEEPSDPDAPDAFRFQRGH